MFVCRLCISVVLLNTISLSVSGQAIVEHEPKTKTQLELASVFSNHMVLQRNQKIPVWGMAAPQASVRVELADQTKETIADDQGNWRIDFAALPAGGPWEMDVSSNGQNIHLEDILVGEVWLASGQSNMQWSVGNSKNPGKESAGAISPAIRLLEVSRQGKMEIQNQFPTQGWKVCSPETVKNFSAVAYFFGSHLHQEIDVPVGLISSNFGGTPMEAWTSLDALDSNSTFAWYAQFAREPIEDGEKEPWKQIQNRPSALYNAMIHPLVPYGIRGVIWYQGESNAHAYKDYRELSELMITDWRKRWGQGNFPFLLVQLAGWKPGVKNWPFLREAQWQTIQTVPHTGMAVAMDVGDPADIHPTNKHDVGKRLALWALAQTYGKKDLEYSGPMYRVMEVRGNEIWLQFEHVGDGLHVDGTQLSGFTIAGKDKKFVDALARIEGEQIVVSHPEVSMPIAVRYNWWSDHRGNLYNAARLPAVPFRTDDFAP